ncbi:M16 family metallopeptidase [Hymenobacter sp. B81]|uniref:M16 family metallopeptidase n=1 Tax=Hymenobacter sp. B81 TaxID=3344878 RepID=UPI0037DC0128
MPSLSRLAPWRRGLSAALLLALAACSRAPWTAPSLAPAASFQVPIDYYTLPNGLQVVLSPDHSAPLVTVALHYRIGFRQEPVGRTGFAHLFEHLMFEPSAQLGPGGLGSLVQQSGGVFQGSTRYDFTTYYCTVPAHKLETMLWAEADRMRGPRLTQAALDKERNVVKNEVRERVLSQPYAGLSWLDMPQVAHQNRANAHNFYGDFRDLDAATLAEAQAFFRTYYAPNNACLVVTGDFEPAEAKAWIQRYFGPIPAAPRPPQPDTREPRQRAERRIHRVDSLVNRPALAFAYHLPKRGTPAYYAMGLLDQILLQGTDGRLTQALTQRRGYASAVRGGANVELGNLFNYEGPMLWTGSLLYDPQVPADSVVAALDQEINRVIEQGVDAETLALAQQKLRSSLYDLLGQRYGYGTADLLACFALFDRDPAKLNRLETEFRRVTPALLQRTAREYLRPGNRTLLFVAPAPTAQATPRP